jgi:deoxyribodipyrimidine photo-lyase
VAHRCPGAQTGGAPAAALPSLQQLGFEAANLAQLAIPTGMRGGARLFDDFLGRIAGYGAARDYPAVKGPSYLSLHLRFGTVSIRHLVRTVTQLSARGQAGDGAAIWLSELIWREFYMMILYHHPHVAHASFKPAYDAIQWETGPDADALFAAWCEGRTGYPLVDAAMAQLNRTGYMHNRLRMVTACFLIKDLGIDWRRGEAYFAQQLNDFDLAANNGGWQWASSSGCDAQPYFRIFNPVTQSEKFDPEGKFIKRYLPQLAALHPRDIHAPWRAPRMMVQDYPPPLVMHDEARRRTLERYAVVKSRKP